MGRDDFEDRMASLLARAEGSDNAARLGFLEEVCRELEAELEGALEMARPADDVGSAPPT